MDRRRPSEPVRVLCYSPYTMWELHGLWETTILHGLRLRGADVRYVLCDGLYRECDMFWAATNPRHPLSCTECQANQASLMGRMGMPYEWLGRYVLPAETAFAKRFAAQIPDADLPGATYFDWPVGEWVASSVHSHFRSSHLDLADPRVALAYRGYVESGLVAAFGLTRLLDEFEPDVMLQFNGRQSSTRVAFELAQERGIRVVGHETGIRVGSLALSDDEPTVSLEPQRRVWADWRDVPLTEQELGRVRGYLVEREQGRAQYRNYNAPEQSAAAVRAALGLHPGRPLWVVFTSSDDEVAADPEWQGPFPGQLDWIDRTVAWAAAHPEVDLVVRAHPNSGGVANAVGRNESLLRAYEELATRLPANVRVVQPAEEVNSYTLMDLADVGLVWHSTVGLELALKGKRVVVGAGCIVRGLGFSEDVCDADGYEAQLDALLAAPGPLPLEQVRIAYRWTERVFFANQFPFPLIEMVEARKGRPAYRSFAELEPGRDATLDRICRILLEGEPVSPPPSAADLARPADAEDAFLEAFAAERPRSFAVLATAEEAIADPTILGAWAAQFGGSDDATLIVETGPSHVAALVAAVEAAGLGGDGSADVIATATPPSRVAAILSRRPGTDTPTFPPERADELRALATRVWGEAA